MQKIGFLSLLSIVVGSQIGSGAFMLPAILAPYGWYSLVGWLISTLGAISLAVVFAELAKNDPVTGGPHIYVERAFGERAGFLVGWGYWIVSWISTAAVITAAVGYITNAIGHTTPAMTITLEIGILLLFTWINLSGIQRAAKLEILLSLLKFLPLVILPLFALRVWDANNITLAPSHEVAHPTSLIAKVVMLTMWGFIGVESGLAPANSIENPKTSIPKAIIFGVLITSSLYIFNNVAVMGALPSAALVESSAPYADLSRMLFGGGAGVLIAIVGALVCLGTLNAWIVTSSQIMLGLSNSKFFPSRSIDPVRTHKMAVLSSTVGLIPILFLTSTQGLAGQIGTIIDISVVVFLVVYLLSSISCLKLKIKGQINFGSFMFVATLFASGFSLLTLALTPLSHTLIALGFIASGIAPMLWRR